MEAGLHTENVAGGKTCVLFVYSISAFEKSRGDELASPPTSLIAAMLEGSYFKQAHLIMQPSNNVFSAGNRARTSIYCSLGNFAVEKFL